jgi:cytochrome c553
MLTHQAAVDVLWAGLITPDTEAWRRGARSLASGSFVASNRETQRAVRELQAVARQSIEAPSERREELMANTLATCAECHRMYGVGVASPRRGIPR